jgi:hypothetical protein
MAINGSSPEATAIGDPPSARRPCEIPGDSIQETGDRRWASSPVSCLLSPVSCLLSPGEEA